MRTSRSMTRRTGGVTAAPQSSSVRPVRRRKTSSSVLRLTSTDAVEVSTLEAGVVLVRGDRPATLVAGRLMVALFADPSDLEGRSTLRAHDLAVADEQDVMTACEQSPPDIV